MVAYLGERVMTDLSKATRAICVDVRGEDDDFACVQSAYTALKRGIELAKEKEQPNGE